MSTKLCLRKSKAGYKIKKPAKKIFKLKKTPGYITRGTAAVFRKGNSKKEYSEYYNIKGNRVGDDIGGINGKVNGIKLESLHASKVGPLGMDKKSNIQRSGECTAQSVMRSENPIRPRYQKLLSDLRKSRVKGIERAYIFSDKICIDVEQGRLEETKWQICKLESYEDYESLLNIKECQRSKLFGKFACGAPVTGLTEDNPFHTQIIQTYRNFKSFNDIPVDHTVGTVGCFVKDEGKFYGLTAQHILATETAHGRRSFFTLLQNGNDLSGIIYVGSQYWGFIGSHFQGVNAMAVDAAVFTMDQLCLDEIQLTKLPIITVEGILPSDQEHKYYVVEKIGATTGRTFGIIVDTRVETTLPDNNLASMFYVAPLSNGSSGVFADVGDSGALVSINVKGTEYALGIVRGGGKDYKGFQHVTYCVEVKYCLEAIVQQYGATSMPDLYKGFLRPQA